MYDAPEKTINDLAKELAELENLLYRFEQAKGVTHVDNSDTVSAPSNSSKTND